MKPRLAIFILPFAFVATIFAQERYVMPIDEAKMDASLVVFRTKLIAAVERRDPRFILSIVDPKIRLSFGDAAGLADFKKMWKVDDRNSKFWDEFRSVITNGGTFFPVRGRPTKLFYAPYSFNAFPSDLDPYEHAMIFGSKVALREQPNLSSQIITRLSYNVVKIDDSDPAAADKIGWHKVQTLGNKSGYVKAEYVRSAVDYRAAFEKKKGKWRMVAFIAGD